jgi:hypothetical protein
VTWEKNPFSTDIHNEIYIDTINRVPYSNPYLNEILFIDSVLKSINLEQIESEENIANDYILTLYRSAHIINDQEIEMIKFNIYNPQVWRYNKVGVYTDQYGIIFFLPSHRYDKIWLRKRIIDSDTQFILDKDKLKAILNDSILFPMPEPPDSIPIIKGAN